jgi:hypothetical protein
MKRGSNKILSLFLFGLLFISFVIGSVGFVSADDGIIKKLWDTFFGGLFEDNYFNIGDNQIEISRILLMFLVLLLVYSISDFLPFFPQNKDYIKWLFAGVVAVLSFLFVSGEDIKLILTNYEALGVMLTSIIPLVIIMAFTFKLGEKNKKMAYFVNPFLIIGFILYSILKWHYFTADGPLKTAYLWTAALGFIWLIGWTWFLKKYEKAAFEGVTDVLGMNLKKQQAKRKAEAESFDEESKKVKS